VVPPVSGLEKEGLEKIEVPESILFCEGPTHTSIHTSIFKMNFSRELIGSVTCVRLSSVGRVDPSQEQAVNIVVGLDVSGSMNDGSKLRNVLLSLEQLLTYLRDYDFLTIVPFNGALQRPFPVLQESCTVTGKALIQEKLAAIRADGNTNLEAAIRSASEVLAIPLPPREGGIKSAVLLLTDGAATAGELDHTRLVEFQAANLAAFPDALFCTVGYGDDHQAELCRRLALNGPYSIVRSGEDVGAVIGDLLGGLRTVAATSVRLTVPLGVRQKTGFKVLAAPGAANQEIHVGNLVAGGNQVILLEGLADEEALGLHYVLADGTVRDIANVVISGPTAEVQEAGQMALLRCEVLEIMEHARRHLVSGSHVTDASIIGQSLMLRARLEALPNDSAVALLLRELNKAHSYLSMPAPPPAIARHLTNQLSQHTEYLGTARGIMSSTYEEDEDPESRNTSIFSSSAQRAMSSGMAQAVRSASSVPDPRAIPVSPLGSQASGGPPPAPTRSLTRAPSNPY